MDKINEIKKVITEADAVVIGAGAGLSTAAGFVYNGERFEKYFKETRKCQQVWKNAKDVRRQTTESTSRCKWIFNV